MFSLQQGVVCWQIPRRLEKRFESSFASLLISIPSTLLLHKIYSQQEKSECKKKPLAKMLTDSILMLLCCMRRASFHRIDGKIRTPTSASFRFFEYVFLFYFCICSNCRMRLLSLVLFSSSVHPFVEIG